MADFADPDLGEVLLEQKPSKGSIGNAIFLIILGAPMMAIVAAPNAPADVRIGFFAFGLGLVAFSLIMLWRNWMHVFLQERGICEYRQRRRRTLAYDHVDEIIYSSLRIFMNGAYMHTVQKIALASQPMQSRPLVCTNIFKETDGRGLEKATAVTRIRDSVSARLANQFSQLLEKQQISWTSKIRVHRRGIEMMKPGDEWELIEWSRITRHEVDQSTFRLWVDSENKARVQIGTIVPNFYPLYLVAMARIARAPKTAQPS